MIAVGGIGPNADVVLSGIERATWSRDQRSDLAR